MVHGGGAVSVPVVDEGLLRRAVATWGVGPQIGMVIEECAELIAALNRYHRGRVERADVASEIADVLIMAHQARILFGVDLVDEALSVKTARLRARLDEVAP